MSQPVLAASSSRRSWRRATASTRHPSATRRAAVARPIPEEAPVTTAVGWEPAEAGRRSESVMDPAYDVPPGHQPISRQDRKSTRLNSSHVAISYAVFCLKKKTETHI